MKLKYVDLLCIVIFLVVSIIDPISVIFQLRLAGQNILNPRLWSFLVAFILLRKPLAVGRSDVIIVFWMYCLIYLVLELLGHYDLQSDRLSRFNWMYYNHLLLGIAIYLRLTFTRWDNVGQLRSIVFVIHFCFFIGCILNIFAIINNPTAVRGNTSYYFEDRIRARAFGLAGYGFVSALPFLVPLIVQRIKHYLRLANTRHVLIWIIYLILVMLSSYLSVIVAPFLLSLLFLVLALLGRKRIKTNLTVIIAIIALYILVPKGYVSEMLLSASSATPNSELSRKLRDLSIAVKGGLVIVDEDLAQGSVEGRASRIGENLKYFIENPLIGRGVSSSGEHIYWLHLLAQFGLIGAIPVFVIIRITLKRDPKILLEEYRFYYYLSFGAFILIGFIKAISGFQMLLVPFFLAPATGYLYWLDDNRAKMRSLESETFDHIETWVL